MRILELKAMRGPNYWSVKRHDIIVNPLTLQGYPSIGCMPCTSKVEDGEDPRAGRWRGKDKTECGLHLS